MHSRIDPRLLMLWSHDGNGHVAGRRRGDAPGLDEVLQAAIQVATDNQPPLVLAVSGGRDSMSLMYAMNRWARQRIAAIATFDHGTGGPATEAAALVAAEARRLGLTVVRERARGLAATEQAWREARWEFLRRVARAYRARVATAHTRDDQLETVVMRILRGSGARGLAALAAPGDIVRPWLPVTRDEIAEWAAKEQVDFIEDPANYDRRFLRVRMRLDIIPALEVADPGFGEAMLSIADRAATWRRDVESWITNSGHIREEGRGRVKVDAALFDGVDDDARAMLWQALLGRIGVALDGTGTQQLVRFSNAHRRGAQLAVAGGARVLSAGKGRQSWFDVRSPVPRMRIVLSNRWSGRSEELPRRVGQWRFRRVEGDAAGEGAHVMAFPRNSSVTIRPWQPGDRFLMKDNARRRVARYFVEAGVPAPDRSSWPVVLVDDEVVWVPGVCRSSAAPFRPDRPELIWYRCERDHG